MLKIINWNGLSKEEQIKVLQRPELATSQNQMEQVRAIVAEVKEKGDSAVLAYTRNLDRVDLKTLKVTAAEFDFAEAEIQFETRAAIEFAREQIKQYHTAQIPQTLNVETTMGIQCKREKRAIEKVGLYIPGGSAPLISTVLMLAIPAELAGCVLRVICTPPNQAGRIDSNLLVAARLCGIT